MPRAAAKSRKVAANLSVRADLVKRARALKVNLSEVLEGALEETLRERERRMWLEENEQAIREYNERIERDGAFGDRWRRF